MNKFTIKAISMILMLAMTLSVTAMAATTSTEVNTDPNAYAFYNYLHRDYVWNSGWNGADSNSWSTIHDDNVVRGEVSGKHLTDLETSNYHDYKRMTNYKSAYGAPLETWNYLNSRYETNIASRWLNLLMDGFILYNYDATNASEYLAFLTANLDDGFVYLYENYGEKAALAYAKSFTFTDNGYNSGDPHRTVKCLNAQEWLTETATRVIDPVVYQPINMAPMNGAPVANDPNKAVATKMTMQVNGVAQTFDVMTLHNTTYFKLSDLANAMGFKYHVTDRPCISNGADFTLGFASLSHKGCGDVKGATKATIIANGGTYSLCAVYSMDAHSNGAVYYALRDIAEIMNFNVGWTAQTGATISNKSSFNEGVSGKPGQYDSRIHDTSTWNETTHRFDK